MGDLGLLPPDSVARRVDRELFVLLGGPAALLMQIAHPLVAAGVAEHSDFSRNPLGRLRRTLDLTLTVVFGDHTTAQRALRQIGTRHGTVRGRAADGRPYDARDPALLLWVQATLVLTSLRLYQLIRGPLSRAERQAYWDETKPIAGALGIPEGILPDRVEDLERYEQDALVSDVRPDATSIALGRQVLRPFGWLPAPLHWPSDVLTAGLLPAALRAPFGLRWRARERLLFRAVIVALRLLRRAVPERWALVPQARRFEDRIAP